MSEKENKMFKEAIKLLELDGWVKIDESFDGQTALIFTTNGEIILRYVTWESEYSEWHQCSRYYPSFNEFDSGNWDDVDDNHFGLVGALTIPKLTENTKKAFQIMQDFYDEEEMNKHE